MDASSGNGLYHYLTIICRRLLQHLKFLTKKDVALNITLECSEVMLSSFLSSTSHIHIYEKLSVKVGLEKYEVQQNKRFRGCYIHDNIPIPCP